MMVRVNYCSAMSSAEAEHQPIDHIPKTASNRGTSMRFRSARRTQPVPKSAQTNPLDKQELWVFEPKPPLVVQRGDPTSFFQALKSSDDY